MRRQCDCPEIDGQVSHLSDCPIKAARRKYQREQRQALESWNSPWNRLLRWFGYHSDFFWAAGFIVLLMAVVVFVLVGWE